LGAPLLVNRVLRLLPFGIWLATRSPLVRVSLALTAAMALGAVAAAMALRGNPAARAFPALASDVMAWGGGTMIAVGGALRSLRQDREEGAFALARSRGVGARVYGLGRVFGLVAVLLVAVGGGTLAAALAATAAAGRSAGPVFRTGAAALIFAIAFALTIGPVAMAALGGRKRMSGYLVFLSVLVLPEAVAPWTQQILPPGWVELTSIPAALEAVRAGVQSGGHHALHALRAAVGLLAIGAASWMVVRARLVGNATEDG
jgi:hypothetical protein